MTVEIKRTTPSHLRTLGLGALLIAGVATWSGCNTPRGYDEATSRAYRAAWEKRRAGDEVGYKAALAEVASHRGTWAGDRAALDLELVDEPSYDSIFSRVLRQAAVLAGDPSVLRDKLSAPDPTAE